MQVHDVHSRDLAAPVERVGALIDGLGGEDDRLWPTDRWPTTPFGLDGPLAVGTRGRQGQIRQSIEAYEPGRRLVLRFAPGLGLVGTHRLELEPVCADRSRLTHTLECRVEPKLLPVYPILIRQHKALVEDLLDRAELVTTGRVRRAARWPLSVRIANAAELRMMPRRRSGRADRLGRVSAVAVPAVLVLIAGLHVAWALGSPWPAGSERELAERVLSTGERARLDGGLPPAAASWAVAAGLTAAAVIVRAVAVAPRPSRLLRGATWAVSGIFLARGALFIPADLAGGVDDTYERLDLAVYSPLSLALGAGTALVTRRAGAARGASREPVRT